MTKLKDEGKNSAYDVIFSTSSRILLNYLTLRILKAQNHFRIISERADFLSPSTFPEPAQKQSINCCNSSAIEMFALNVEDFKFRTSHSFTRVLIH